MTMPEETGKQGACESTGCMPGSVAQEVQYNPPTVRVHRTYGFFFSASLCFRLDVGIQIQQQRDAVGAEGDGSTGEHACRGTRQVVAHPGEGGVPHMLAHSLGVWF